MPGLSDPAQPEFGSWRHLSVGVAILLMGLLSLGLQPTDPLGEPPPPSASGEASAEPAPDTLVLTGSVPRRSDVRYIPREPGACPSAVMDELRDVLRWEMDFPSDLRPGDSFRAVLVSEPSIPSGSANSGTLHGDEEVRVLGVEIETGGRTRRAVWYESPAGAQPGYFQPDGTQIGLPRIPTPDGFRMTSRFSWGRIHPIHRVRRPHFGVDYGVPAGEPVRAVAAGTVTDVGWVLGFGLVVEIRHDAHRSTRYAHLASVSSEIRPDARVAAGQRLGRAGATGVATGPHLHFEFLMDGEPHDPLAQPRDGDRTTAPPSHLGSFMEQTDRIRKLLATAEPPATRASRVTVVSPGDGRPPRTGPVAFLARTVAGGPTAPAAAGGGRPLPTWPLSASAAGGGGNRTEDLRQERRDEDSPVSRAPSPTPVCTFVRGREFFPPGATKSYVRSASSGPGLPRYRPTDR